MVSLFTACLCINTFQYVIQKAWLCSLQASVFPSNASHMIHYRLSVYYQSQDYYVNITLLTSPPSFSLLDTPPLSRHSHTPSQYLKDPCRVAIQATSVHARDDGQKRLQWQSRGKTIISRMSGWYNMQIELPVTNTSLGMPFQPALATISTAHGQWWLT